MKSYKTIDGIKFASTALSLRNVVLNRPAKNILFFTIKTKEKYPVFNCPYMHTVYEPARGGFDSTSIKLMDGNRQVIIRVRNLPKFRKKGEYYAVKHFGGRYAYHFIFYPATAFESRNRKK